MSLNDEERKIVVQLQLEKAHNNFNLDPTRLLIEKIEKYITNI